MTHATLRQARSGAPVRRLDAAPPAPPVDDDPTPFACPRCGETMARAPFAGGEGEAVIVDVCVSHGTWFDAGELRAALGAGPKASPDLARQAKATLDVALALEQARDDETARRTVDFADDLLDTFNFIVLGRGSRRRKHRW